MAILLLLNQFHSTKFYILIQRYTSEIYLPIDKEMNKWNGQKRLRMTYSYKNINEDIQKMPQSRSTTLPRKQKKERWETNKDSTNATYEITDAQRTATEEPAWYGQYENHHENIPI